MSGYGIEFAQDVTLQEIPKTIEDCVSRLENVRQKVVQARSKADAAYEKAKKASRVDAKNIFTRNDAIDALQNAAVAIADSQIDQAESVKASFEYEKVLSNVCKYLFMLGVANMAANRMVVEQLTKQMDRASEEKLDEMAREELRSVIYQLKDQEDLLNRVDRLERIVREQKDTLDLLSQKFNGTGDRSSEDVSEGRNIAIMKAQIRELKILLEDQEERLEKLEQ